MREIEFRGKMDYDYYREERWTLGYCCEKNGDSYIINSWGREILVDWQTVGEWTGLKDKNGQRIYEGDVLKFSWDSPCGLVEFCGMVKFRAKDAAFRVWCDNLKDWAVFSVFSRNDMEVIGNVFDDPELKERFWKVWNQENNEKITNQ